MIKFTFSISHIAKVLILLSLIGLSGYAQKKTSIKPGELWPDNNGNHINAHGGGIIKLKDTYYWYGEEHRKLKDPHYRYVSCYTSKDLMNWTSQGTVLSMKEPDTILRNWVLERPKVFYNKKTNKFVMYMHVDGEIVGQGGDYLYAQVGIAVSDHATGPFTFIKCFRPFGHISRDIGQFIDDDGTAYLIFEDRPSKGFHIARLSGDYMNVEEDVCLIKSPLEGGAIVNYQGLYYAIGSALTGWVPNPNKYATATSLKGPWTEFKDIAPPETNTYNSQSTLLLKVIGDKQTTVVFLADQWKKEAVGDSRYLWMPVHIGDGRLWLPEPRPWSINVRTGDVKFLKKDIVKK
ncbi:family 43 glycosylhydrolase [Pedobacter sp. AW31-3R]|uniref:family 43 glycosylhydrolase n=1 Tax=Pedobacter sp. AW31-3R TaxID=3445781 RepID=UPI003FA0729E